MFTRLESSRGFFWCNSINSATSDRSGNEEYSISAKISALTRSLLVFLLRGSVPHVPSLLPHVVFVFVVSLPSALNAPSSEPLEAAAWGGDCPTFCGHLGPFPEGDFCVQTSVPLWDTKTVAPPVGCRAELPRRLSSSAKFQIAFASSSVLMQR